MSRLWLPMGGGGAGCIISGLWLAFAAPEHGLHGYVGALGMVLCVVALGLFIEAWNAAAFFTCAVLFATPVIAEEQSVKTHACFAGWETTWGHIPLFNCCAPVSADTSRCKERTHFECVAGEIIIASHLIACSVAVNVHNERCVATQEVYAAHEDLIATCTAGWALDETIRVQCHAAEQRLKDATSYRDRIFKKTEARLR